MRCETGIFDPRSLAGALGVLEMSVQTSCLAGTSSSHPVATGPQERGFCPDRAGLTCKARTCPGRWRQLNAMIVSPTHGWYPENVSSYCVVCQRCKWCLCIRPAFL